jgi:hypothetical protein
MLDAVRAVDLRALAWRVRPGMGRPFGFFWWTLLVKPCFAMKASFVFER